MYGQSVMHAPHMATLWAVAFFIDNDFLEIFGWAGQRRNRYNQPHHNKPVQSPAQPHSPTTHSLPSAEHTVVAAYTSNRLPPKTHKMPAKTVSPEERVAIGIAFGNSYSSIACTVDGSPVVIANEDGDRQIPTVLSYVDGEEYTGNQAKAFLIRNAKNTVVSFKDFLGKEYVLPHTQSHMIER